MSWNDLSTIKNNGQDWYKSYLGPKGRSGTLVVTMYRYPYPLEGRPSIYPVRETYDRSSNIITKHYQERGIKVIIAGPVGLGAAGFKEFGDLINLIIEHKEVLKYIPLLFKIGKAALAKYRNYKKDKRAKYLRSKRFKISIDISLYLPTTSENTDLIPYCQQLVLDYAELVKKFETLGYIDYYPTFRIITKQPNLSLILDMRHDPQLINTDFILKRLDKISPFTQSVRLTYEKRWLWRTLNSSQYT